MHLAQKVFIVMTAVLLRVLCHPLAKDTSFRYHWQWLAINTGLHVVPHYLANIQDLLASLHTSYFNLRNRSQLQII